MTLNPQTTDEYIDAQQEVLSHNPECGTTRYNLALALIRQGRWEDAATELMEAVRCCPTLAEAYVALGGIYLQKGELDACVNANKNALAARPRFSLPYGNLGFAYMQMGQPEFAVQVLERAITLNPKFVQAHATLANAYFALGRLDESITASKRALELDNTFAPAHNNLAVAYCEQNNYQLAIEHCDKAISFGFAVATQFLDELAQHR